MIRKRDGCFGSVLFCLSIGVKRGGLRGGLQREKHEGGREVDAGAKKPEKSEAAGG